MKKKLSCLYQKCCSALRDVKTNPRGKAFIILSTQRSGSTLLCKDMESTGVMGKPGEHMLKYLSEKQPFDVEGLIREGGDKKGNFGLKLMCDYIEYAARIFNTYACPGQNNASILTTIKYLSERYDQVVVIYLTRDDYFEQALSKITAEKTNSWHDYGQGLEQENGDVIDYSETRNKRLEVIKSLSPQEINKCIANIMLENRKLAELFDSIFGDNVEKYKTNYNEVVYASEHLLSSINGSSVSVQRTMKRVSGERDVLFAKEKYFADLQKMLPDSE